MIIGSFKTISDIWQAQARSESRTLKASRTREVPREVLGAKQAPRCRFRAALFHILLLGFMMFASLSVPAGAADVFTGHWTAGSESRAKHLSAERRDLDSGDIEAVAALDLEIYYALRAQENSSTQPPQKSGDLPDLTPYLGASISENLQADIVTALMLESLRGKDFSKLSEVRARYLAEKDSPLRRYTLACGRGHILQSLALHAAARDVFSDILAQQDFQALPHFTRDHADILLRLSELSTALEAPDEALIHAQDAAMAYHYFASQNPLSRGGTSVFLARLNLTSAAAFAGAGQLDQAAEKADSALQDAKASGDNIAILTSGLLLGELALQQGNLAGALSRFRDVRESPFYTGQSGLSARLYQGFASAYEAQGSLVRALDMFKSANQSRAAAERALSARRSLYFSVQTNATGPLSGLPAITQNDIDQASHHKGDIRAINSALKTLDGGRAGLEAGANQAAKRVKDITYLGSALTIAGILTALFSYIRLRRVRRQLNFSKEQLQRSEQREKDITKKSQENLQSLQFADDAKKAFLANVSHEIRTPMSGVLGLADVLRRTTRLGARQQEIVDTIYHSSQGVVSLLGDVLDYSKLESGTFEMNISKASLRVMAENVAALMSEEARQKDIEILVRCAPTVPENLSVDIGRLRQVLINLVQNAVKFTDEGYVIINVDAVRGKDEMMLKIQVLDTGIGISEPDQVRIFDDFIQLEQGRDRKYGGTGLGLSISKKLMQAMEGDLTVRSQRGKGSVFTLEFTTELADETSQSGVQAASIFASGRVLLIDSLTPRLKILSAQLKHWGLSCQTVRGPQDAITGLLNAAKTGKPFDAVVIDASSFSGPSGGAAFTDRVQSHAQLRDVPVFLLQHLTQIKSAKPHDVTEQIAKPVRSDALLQVLKSNLGMHLSPEFKEIDAGAPLRQKRPRPITAAPPPQRVKSRILIAEADTAARQIMQSFLKNKSIEIHCARDGEEALEAAKTIDFDIIFMDAQLRKLDGFLVTRALRAHEKEKNADRTPIICLSAFALGADEQLAKIVGMDDFLVKPLSRKNLDMMVKKWAAIKTDIRTAKAARLKAEKAAKVIDPMVKPLKTKSSAKAA